MKKSLLSVIIILLSVASFAQGPSIDAGVDTVTCEECIDLTATFEGGGNTTDYEITDITFSPDPYEGTTVSLFDDNITGALPIGFDFCFYGNTYSDFYICSNGWIGFQTGPTTWNPVAIPSVAGTVPKNCIMGPWHDINPSLGGTIRYQTLGTEPFRRLVVSYDNMRMFGGGCAAHNATQQIIIYETTNEIENHIAEKTSCGAWAGGRAVQGVHNIDGTESVSYAGRNNTTWSATDEAIRYTPLGDPIVEWYIGPLLIGTGPDIEVCPSSTTTYIAKLISCGGIIAEDEVTVEVICCEDPIMTFTDVTCFGGCDGTGTAEGVGVAPFTYLWDAAAGFQTTATAIDLCAGTYEVTVTDALGCVETGEVTISEPEELTGFLVASPLVSCFGLTDATATIEASGGTGTLTYDIGDGPMPTGVFPDLAAGDYTVIITDENGCTLEIPFTVGSPSLLVATMEGVIDVTCNGGADGEITIGATGGTIDYEYSIDGDPFVDSGVFGGLGAGSYDFEVRDANGCTSTITVEVNEPPLLTLGLVSTTDVTCFGGDDGALEVIGAGGTGALEYSDDAVTFGPAATFTGLSEGTYTITVRDENDCETTLDVDILEPLPVDADEVIVGESCLGDCDGTIDLDGLDGFAPYTYSIDDCATTDGFGTYAGLCAGDYDICIVDANGCEYNSTVTVPDGTAPADATIVSLPSMMCIDEAPVTLSAVDPGGVYTGTGVVDGTTFDPAVAGIGTHTITNTIAIGCGDVATFDVTVNPLPVVSFSTTENSGCEPHTAPFTYGGDAGTACLWDFGDGSFSEFCGSVNHTYDNPGEFDVSLTVTDANGCVNTSTAYSYIEVYPVPNAAFRFGPQPTTTINTEIRFTDMSSGADSWDWTFGELGNSNDQDPIFFFPEIPGEHIIKLMVSNQYGCTDETDQTVIISEQYLMYVPNTITPDGDAFNEVFKPYFNGIDIYDYTLEIYNRWGEPVFESHNVDVGWNGTYAGEIVESGVYIWHIITHEISSDKVLEYHGHVTILK